MASGLVRPSTRANTIWTAVSINHRQILNDEDFKLTDKSNRTRDQLDRI